MKYAPCLCYPAASLQWLRSWYVLWLAKELRPQTIIAEINNKTLAIQLEKQRELRVAKFKSQGTFLNSTSTRNDY